MARVLVGVLAPMLLCRTLGPYALWQSRIQYEQRAELNSQNLASDDHVQQRLQVLIGRCGCFNEDRIAVGAPVHAVQHQAVRLWRKEGCSGWPPTRSAGSA